MYNYLWRNRGSDCYRELPSSDQYPGELHRRQRFGSEFRQCWRLVREY
ncbi:hypothetical protein BOS5A_10433 [Bosea sp. EC-HK365B]|nr:hypothetical protein BOSE7B_150498 [Bosea sp. 7B]VVT44322.1 hypothetical protein BOS5A_10433 [Bosea sp. EC-HK365B]